VIDLLPLFVATFRDWVIIFMGIAVAAFFVVALIITLVLGIAVACAPEEVTLADR
jgi:hypothetical protein